MVDTVEDMDSLDDKLFGNASKRNPFMEDSRKRITFADEDDPLADLLTDKEDFLSGIDRSKATDDKAKKLSLMQDLFSDTLHVSSSKESNISKKSLQSEYEVTQATEVPRAQSQHSLYAPTAFRTKEPRRGKRTSEIINDPLGLFASSTISNQTEQTTVERRSVSADSSNRQKETKEYLPDWLESKPISENTDFIQDKVTPTDEFDRRRRSSSDKMHEVVNAQQEDETKLVGSLPYEKEKPIKSSNSQTVEIDKVKKRKSEEDYPKPNTAASVNPDVSKASEDASSLIHKTTIGYESAIQKLELEKSHLNVTINSLNEKYENEITILDESYKRQIGFLQERTDTLEKRLQQELEYLETDYEAKIEKLKNEKMQTETFYKEEIQNLKKEHAQIIEEIYERHSQNIKLLQKEHFDTIENILKMREVENLAMTTIATHKTDLQNLLQKADSIIESIKTTQEKTDQRDDQSIKLREHYLKSQEEDMQIRNVDIKKRQELLEQERDRMIKVADKLDSHVAQLVLELEKKSTLLNETLETLKKKEEVLLHEREMFEEKVQWERNQLQALKESWFNEQEKQLKTLIKEKEIIAAKRKQYEVLRTIKSNSDNITNIEMAAAIKTAQDATILANQERLKWQEKVKYLEKQQQVLQEKEHRLLTHAQDLESFTQLAFARNEEAVKTLKEFRHIEDDHKAKLDPHFNVFDKFNSASEKLALTAQLEKLKKSANIPYNYADTQALSNQQRTFKVTTHFTEVVDPQLVMLKLNLDDQLDNVQYM
ncbi:golgin subfamily A member 4-like isoform X2 [Pseudomyrmex gracilis]|uniref:golgin subfamily A member 4-like isoform X2 n=1 Tax=Pseudomyrmex gracilis TaxID=219809 RepID=UPI000995B57F|nr:golgin subfamily A member 4-like isoform X2 [Pseudomyrmex gracilis]